SAPLIRCSSRADVNPYLVLTAILWGMLHGLETEAEVPLPLDHPEAVAAQPLGHDWFDAVERFVVSDVAEDIFGAEFRRVFAAVKQDEIQTLTGMITPVEYRYYLNRL
ncbi:MAG: glutamine synthetase, partial [Pseudomonadota bacterium]